jgi:hypothetical protein
MVDGGVVGEDAKGKDYDTHIQYIGVHEERYFYYDHNHPSTDANTTAH